MLLIDTGHGYGHTCHVELLICETKNELKLFTSKDTTQVNWN